MIHGSGWPSRPDWTDRSTHRQNIAAHRPVLPPPAAEFPAGAGRPVPENIVVFQSIASLSLFAVPAGARSRPGRTSRVTLCARRILVLNFRPRSETTPGSPEPPGTAARAAPGRNDGRRKGYRVSFRLLPPRIGLRLSCAARKGADVSGNVMFCHSGPCGLACRAGRNHRFRRRPPNAARESLQREKSSYNVLFIKSQPARAIVRRSHRHPRHAGRRSHDGLRRQAGQRRVSAARSAGIGELLRGLGLRQPLLASRPNAALRGVLALYRKGPQFGAGGRREAKAAADGVGNRTRYPRRTTTGNIHGESRRCASITIATPT